MNFRHLLWPLVAICLVGLVPASSSAQQNASATTQLSAEAHPTAGKKPTANQRQVNKDKTETPSETPNQAGPRKADDEGRTRLPMEVRKSVSFREIGPAISGGRVSAVAGVSGNSEIYYVGAADGGVFRTNDGGMTWKALFQHESVASIGALAVDPVNPEIVWAGTGESNVRNNVSFGDGV